MQSDLVQISSSGHQDDAAPQESLARSLKCTKCTLIFKSKVYLFEHLNKVHHLDIDASLREAGLRYAESKKAHAENSKGVRKSFTCRNCDFKTCIRDVWTKHETQCPKPESPNLTETVIIPDSPDRDTPDSLGDQNDEAEDILGSKDLRTYKRPSQTITKYFSKSSRRNDNLKLDSDAILVDTTPDASLHWKSKATKLSDIDLDSKKPGHLLRYEHLYQAKVVGSGSLEEQTNLAINEINRKTNNDSLKGPKIKKAKLTQDSVEENEDTSGKLAANVDFSFEVSDDDEEKKAELVSRDPARPDLYFCKHCDYSNRSFSLVSSHYQSDHPYVRCNASYIKCSADQSATFRCLECPVEFLSTVDLKWHYTEKHPEAPDVFKIKLNELSLVFKCFTCTFTCKEMRVLMKHYKEKHPTCEVDNSLLFCQYLVSECQGPSQQERCEETSSPERSATLSPKKMGTPCKEVEITPSCQPPSSTVSDATPYKCSKCEFAHKSTVVMQVHYQKKHPEQAVTIDEIKQLSKETMQRTPERETSLKETAEVHPEVNALESVLQTIPEVSKTPVELLKIKHVRALEEDLKIEVSRPKPIIKTTNRSEDLEVDEKVSSQKAKYKPEPALQNVSKVTLLEESSEDSKKSFDFSTPKCLKSAKNESKANMSPSKPNIEATKSKAEGYVYCSPLEMHYCQFCDYSNPYIRSVIGHHNAKHSNHVLLSKADIIQYSAKVINGELERETIQNTDNRTKKRGKNEAKLKKNVTKKSDPYMNAEKLFYCHLCNFGNPSTQGVIAHQYRNHRYPYSSHSRVLEYTALMREKIKKSKSEGTSPGAQLPLPILNKDDKEAFFCPICNYRNRQIAVVVDHYSRVHHKVSNKIADIRLYTAKVLNKLQKSPLKSAKNQELPEKPESKNENRDKSLKTLVDSAPPVELKLEKLRKLPCKYCSFTTQYVFLLMSHMRKIHRSKLSVAGTLRLCYRKGALEPGYHCEWCVFSHKEAEAVHKHYQERHPGCKQMSLEALKARLYVSPDESPSQGRTGLESDQEISEKNKEIHSCTKCSFKSNSKISLASHCNKFHSSSDKNDPLDRPSDKKTSAMSQLEDLNEMPGLFESFQVPLEDVVQETLPSSVFKCPLCPATFDRKHGLRVHSGIKHLKLKNTDEADKQPKQIEGRVHVYKCPYCTYINTSYQGILSHCHMTHPTSTSRADSLQLDPAHLQDLEDYRKRVNTGETLKFSGYVCKTCSKICATLDKLKRHREQEHNEAPKPSLGLRIKLAKPHRNPTCSKASLLTKKVYVRLRCQQCPYVCSTNIRLSKHMHEQHKDDAHNSCVYKCELCPQLYTYKKRLAKHYLRTHGRTAYLKCFVPVYKPGAKKQDPSSEQENKSKDSRFIYRCPSCPYVNTSYHGTLTHSQMKHPSIFIRADTLETGEIFVSNIVGCSKGKESYERGYLCKRCPEIHPSIKKLKIHCQKQHGEAAVSELLSESDEHKEVGDSSQVADDAADPLKATLQDSVHLQKEKGKPNVSDEVNSQVAGSKAKPKRNALYKKDLFYQCQLCTYSAFSRKNLQAHYKSSHKLDALNTYKLLERYNKRKNNFLLKYFTLKTRFHTKCKECPDLAFDSSQSLIDHYNSFHHLSAKTDFTVLSLGARKGSTGLYRCKFCKMRLHGIRNLCRHLDRHRDQMKAKPSNKSIALEGSTAASTSPEASQQNEQPTVKEDSQQMDTALPSSPQPSPSKPDTDLEAKTQEDRYACKLCQKTFMSLKGLRSHEQSHAAMGAIKKLDNMANAEFQLNMKKYLFHKPGTVKRFRCLCCRYRTSFLGLWQSHFLKNHQNIIEKEIMKSNDKEEKSSESPGKEVLGSSEKINSFPEVNEEPEDVEESTEMYSEPPDVQRQLTHYSLMAHNVDRVNMNLHEVGLSDSLLQCEMCNFNTAHLSSIRRHYSNRHGKKILRCKDCDFFTGMRKTMEMHLETGHSTCQSKPTHLKDLRCPLCLYQTKNKNNMIDHIVLHREERVMPIEVRRPKLSRYLQGLIFRCHKCTFTSGSAESLRLHMTRHNDVKPYKCRLCYFDCPRLADLEAHLSDKHQVLRNHELVGQVSLDQLEAKMGIGPEDDEDYKCDNGELETEEINADQDSLQTDNVSECSSTKILRLKDVQETQELHEGERVPANSFVLDSTQDVTQQITTVVKRHEQDLQTQGQDVPLHHSVKEHYERNTDSNAEEQNNAEIKHGSDSLAEKEQTCTNQTTLAESQKEAAAEGSSTSLSMGAIQAEGEHFTAKSIEAIVRDDLVRNVLVLGEDGSKCKSHGKPNPEESFKVGPETVANCVDNEKNDKLLSIKDGSISLAPNLKHQGNNDANPTAPQTNPGQENKSKLREGFRFEPHLLTLPPNCKRLRLGHRESWTRLLESRKQEEKQSPKLTKDETEPNGEESIFKKCVEEDQLHLEQFEEEEEPDHLELKLEEDVEFNNEDEEEGKILDTPQAHDGVLDMDGAAEPLHEKLFTCELCGRNLMNITELNRHIMRHGV
ncbi:PREDICTED: zinc finger protein 462-like [Cyprinodon variegatus]|uniref:Zinc finger protein 462-like n=1 Tax=Cyprinodon variegatus TaxID=28743 RepID=A0A3Q2EAK3_CYPVA|nr:PREDICTED: zinc finger protein 462-like [Cyprinodon variegatus]